MYDDTKIMYFLRLMLFCFSQLLLNDIVQFSQNTRFYSVKLKMCFNGFPLKSVMTVKKKKHFYLKNLDAVCRC